MGARSLLLIVTAPLALVAATPALAGSTPAGASCGCVPTTHQVKVPGVTISQPQIDIGLPSISVSQSSASASASASANASSNVSVTVNGSAGASTSQTASALLGAFGGGSGSWTPENSVSTDIPDLKIETKEVLPPPAYQQICAAWKANIRQVAIQASCLDDKAVPHPASQVSPDRAVAPTYEGEVYRCIAGARMQYTIADYSGQVDFNHGQTVVCEKGQALYHSASGALQCRAQAPARDCNERSLLRRFGAGIKILAMGGAQVCAAWRQQVVAAAPPPAAGPMVLN